MVIKYSYYKNFICQHKYIRNDWTCILLCEMLQSRGNKNNGKFLISNDCDMCTKWRIWRMLPILVCTVASSLYTKGHL